MKSISRTVTAGCVLTAIAAAVGTGIARADLLKPSDVQDSANGAATELAAKDGGKMELAAKDGGKMELAAKDGGKMELSAKDGGKIELAVEMGKDGGAALLGMR